jgi:hypothetical protein
MQRALGNMIVRIIGPMLLRRRSIIKYLFVPEINIFFKILAKVHAIMKETCIRVLHSLTIKNYLLHLSGGLG